MGFIAFPKGRGELRLRRNQPTVIQIERGVERPFANRTDSAKAADFVIGGARRGEGRGECASFFRDRPARAGQRRGCVDNSNGVAGGALVFSVAVPAYNEAALLPRLLDSLDVARARYRGGAGAVEIIVGNNGSTDATGEIARARGCVVVDVATRAIAAARNGAARVARGDVLCFVDADSIVHEATFNEIERVMRAGRCVVGATGVRMERMSAGIAVAWALMVPMTRLFGVDTGVVFCRRADFETVGGYREELLAAEDVDLLLRLKRLGWRRGQKFVRTAAARTITSTRKFDRHGDWHYLWLMVLMPLRLLRGRAGVRGLIRSYWYDVRK